MSKKPVKSPIKVTSSDERNELRSALLGHAPKPERQLITLFGAELELQQPTLRAILEGQKGEEDVMERSVSMIIEYAYVPGTNEHVFEDTDREMILNWPFGEDLMELQMTIARLTGVTDEEVKEAEGALKKDPLEEQS